MEAPSVLHVQRYAQGETRTRKGRSPADFESAASTNSATRASVWELNKRRQLPKVADFQTSLTSEEHQLPNFAGHLAAQSKKAHLAVRP
jgi:hypothetical protein